MSNKPASSADLAQVALQEADRSKARIDKFLEWIDRGFEPFWDGQKEMARALVTLSAGTIVLSVSMAQFVMSRVHTLEWLWLLPAAWIALGVCLAMAIGLHELMGMARAWRAFVEIYRMAADAQLERAAEEELQRAQRGDQAAAPKDDASAAPPKALLHAPLLIFMLYAIVSALVYFLFVAGLAAIVAFTVKNIMPLGIH